MTLFRWVQRFAPLLIDPQPSRAATASEVTTGQKLTTDASRPELPDAGVKRDGTGSVAIEGHAFIQNLR